MIRRGSKVRWRPDGSPITMSGKFVKHRFDVRRWRYIYEVVTDDGEYHLVAPSSIVRETGVE